MGWFHKDADKPALSIMAAPADLTKAERKQGVNRFALFVTLAVLLVLLFAWPAIWSVTQEAVVYVGLALFRVAVASVAAAMAVGAAYVAFNWIENTQVGIRLEDDKGLVLFALIVGFCVIFARIVL